MNLPSAVLGPTSHERLTPLKPRLSSIDLLRGVVMVLMALDHTRGYLASPGDVRNVHDPLLFLTRWVTHYCAPSFIFLAGISAFLFGSRGRTKGELSRYLLTRGFWLVLLELTVVLFGWTWDPSFNFFFLQVIWAIGWSLVVLAGLIYLPRWAIAALGIVMIAGHHLLDGIPASRFSEFALIWHILHQPGLVTIAGKKILVIYPLIPWIGVMATGYALGPVFKLPDQERRRWLLVGGAILVSLFVGLRLVNGYGDPRPWSIQSTWSATVLSFINCEKYPPSLQYLAMTLGPAMLALALFDGARGKIANWFMTIGRVPFFYYVAHMYLIHLLTLITALALGFKSGWLFHELPPMNAPAGFGVGLPMVYVFWGVVVLSLYPFCRWFAALKQRRAEWWWSYL